MKVTLYGIESSFTVFTAHYQVDISDNDIVREDIGKLVWFEELKANVEWCKRELSGVTSKYTTNGYNVRELKEAEKIYKSILALVYANYSILGVVDDVIVTIHGKTADKVADATKN